MQEIKKRRIVLASVLKPVDDTRMFEKFGLSLASTGHEVFILGFPAQKQPQSPSIQFLPSINFNRLSLKRFLSPLTILAKTFSLKPDVFIIHTHELILSAVIYKLITGKKIIYDIQENYYYNISSLGSFPGIIAPLLAFWVRLKERVFTNCFNSIIVAEESYLNEMKFLPKETIVLENKFRKSISSVTKRTGYNKLLFSGTIAHSTGIFEALELAEKLHHQDQSIQLTIIGRCLESNTLSQLQKYILDKPYIKLIGGDTLVPHHEILAAIQESNFGIIAYEAHEGLQNKVPTKFYEYLALNLPIIIKGHHQLHPLIKKFNAGIVLNEDTNVDELLGIMMSKIFYDAEVKGVYWEDEEDKLLKII